MTNFLHNAKAMYLLSVATVGKGKNAKPVGASLLAMLLPLAVCVRRPSLRMHLRNSDRQQAGSYGSIQPARLLPTRNGGVANAKPLCQQSPRAEVNHG
jgi:hypothetical protein